MISASHRLELVVERSSGSEARYLHIRRSDTWFGIRIAAHFSFYACSRDYFQVLLDDPPSDHAIAYAHQQFNEIVLGCQHVVAAPSDVNLELQRCAEQKLTHRQVAELRHRLNMRAKWAYELKTSAFVLD